MSTSDSKTQEALSSEYALLSQVANELKNRIDLINVAINDFETALSSLREVSRLSDGENMLIPIGGNILIKVSFVKSEKVLVNVGSGVVVEKSIEEAASYLEEKIKVMRDELKKRVNEYQNVLQRMSIIERQVVGKRV